MMAEPAPIISSESQLAAQLPARTQRQSLDPHGVELCIAALGAIHGAVLKIGQALSQDPGRPRLGPIFSFFDSYTISDRVETDKIGRNESWWRNEQREPSCMPLERAREMVIDKLVEQHGEEQCGRGVDDYVTCGTADLWAGEFEGRHFRVLQQYALEPDDQPDGCQFVALNIDGRNFLRWAVGLRNEWEKAGREFLLQISPAIGSFVTQEQPSFAEMRKLVADEPEAVLDFIKVFTPRIYNAAVSGAGELRVWRPANNAGQGAA